MPWVFQRNPRNYRGVECLNQPDEDIGCIVIGTMARIVEMLNSKVKVQRDSKVLKPRSKKNFKVTGDIYLICI